MLPSLLAAVPRHLERFPVLVALRLVAMRVLQRLLEPHAIISYAAEGTDRIIESLLDHPRRGFYVDVGANHPVNASNTFEFYRRGWRGLTIDGSAKMVAAQRAVRPLDTAVQAVVSDGERDAVFTEFESSDVSSMVPANVKAWHGRTRIVAEHRVRTRTLASICQEHAVPARFEFLSVDVEGHDLEVLRSHDFDAYRPRLVVVEVLGDAEQSVTAYLASQGYTRFGRGCLNAYFIDARS